MKKLTFALTFIFLLLASSCDEFLMYPEGSEGKQHYTDEIPERRFYTIAFKPNNDNIGINVGGGRSLSKEIAQMGHEFFEVVFVYMGSPQNVVARASWELGYQGLLDGVYRTAGGVDYSGLTSNPASGTGSAIMFVGTKDKTLLAVGRLAFVDGVPGAPITTETRAITFEVTALKAGVSYTASESSFRTYSTSAFTSEITDIETIKVHERDFPLFNLTPHELTYARYTFDFEGSIAWSYYQNVFVRAGEGVAYNRKPRYHLRNGLYQYSSYLPQDEHTVFSMTNNQGAGTAFNNPVEFSFDTTDSEFKDGHSFALVFRVPVYALSSAVSNTGRSPIEWNIKPGYNDYWYDLDDGNGGTGGAVFLGTGDVAGFLKGGS